MSVLVLSSVKVSSSLKYWGCPQSADKWHQELEVVQDSLLALDEVLPLFAGLLSGQFREVISLPDHPLFQVYLGAVHLLGLLPNQDVLLIPAVL